MSGLSGRARRLALAGALLACAGFAVPATTDTAAAAPHAAAPFEALQLDLCRDGGPGCRSDQSSVDAGIAAVRDRQPRLVTVNEVCAHDITAMSAATGYHAEFAPARDAGGAPAPCADGRGDYGIAVLAHPDLGALSGPTTERAFAAQDPAGRRQVLLCAPFSGISACTAQLSEHEAVAAQQCRELTGAAAGTGGPALLGGALNLRRGGTPDVAECVPAGWWRADDGGVQHVLGTAEHRLRGAETLPIAGSDLPGLLVRMDA